MGITAGSGKTRPTIVDGIFYPAERGKLRGAVADLLGRSETEKGSCIAAVSPHAGYAYAGPVIASAFKCIQLRPVKTAVLLGPVHRDPPDGAFLPESERFATPLGPVAVDSAAVEKLLSYGPVFSRNEVPHLEEHCLEVQLPFLTSLFPEAVIVPILIGDLRAQAIRQLAEALRLTFQEASDYTVFIASANMASYMKGTDTEGDAEKMMRLIQEKDWRAVAATPHKQGLSSCGAAGIAALLAMLGESAAVERLMEADSRSVDSDPKRMVHYAAFGIQGRISG